MHIFSYFTIFYHIFLLFTLWYYPPILHSCYAEGSSKRLFKITPLLAWQQGGWTTTSRPSTTFATISTRWRESLWSKVGSSYRNPSEAKLQNLYIQLIKEQPVWRRRLYKDFGGPAWTTLWLKQSRRRNKGKDYLREALKNGQSWEVV